MAKHSLAGKGFSGMYTIIRIMQVFLIVVLVTFLADHFYLKSISEFLLHSPGGRRIFFGTLYIVIFGGSGLIIYFSLKSNKEWYNKYNEAIDHIPEKQETTGAENIPVSEIQKNPGLSTIILRYQNYTRSVKYMVSKNTAIHRSSGQRSSWMLRLIMTGIAVLPTLLALIFSIQFLQNRYGKAFDDLLLDIKSRYPIYHLILSVVFYLLSLWIVLRWIIGITNEAFGFVKAKISMDEDYDSKIRKRIFFTEPMIIKNLPIWSMLFSILCYITLFTMLAAGLFTLDPTLIIAGSLTVIISKILEYTLRKGYLSRYFSVSESGDIKIKNQHRTTAFNVSDCISVTIQYRNIVSTGNPGRLIAYRMINQAMNYNTEVPSCIVFKFSGKEDISFGIKELSLTNGEGFDCHETEYFFALLLHKKGFEIVPHTPESLTGDWAAIKRP